MTHTPTTIKYFIYARKSSESDEKQVQSIEDQVSVLQAFKHALNLQVLDVFTEAQSAKQPQARVVFENMIQRIKDGEANGILVWKVDRLSRNPIDGAAIQWLLQQGVIKSIRTPDREYRPEDNVLILNIENSMATQYILDLSKNVKRGLQSKIQKGWMPNRAPLGYLNTRTEASGENYIIKDQARFDIIRKMWELMLTGNYLPKQILAIANKEWGLRTRQYKKSGGNIMSRSGLYRMFTNIFYTGLIDYKGTYVPGKHDPMITQDEFEKVQFLLGRKGRIRPQQHAYAYTGLIKCGECNGTVSATTEKKLLKRSDAVKEYTLYYCMCARKQKNSCQQIRYTNVDLLDETVEETIISLSINPQFREWVFEAIDQSKDMDANSESKIVELQKETLEKANRQLQNLTQMRLKELIDDEEYLREKTRLKNEITVLEHKLSESSSHTDDWIIPTKESFEFVFSALSRFQTGSPQTKREILSTMTGGLNCALKDKILNIPKAKTLVYTHERLQSYEAEFGQVELEKNLNYQGQKHDSEAILRARLAVVDDVRTVIQQCTDSSPPSYTSPP